ncbi:MAG: motility associated factor glycosyltransferase family protein [Treponema sp.]|nr:motility associated factor glycosyltransferase family protein [Treponema sp.]
MSKIYESIILSKTNEKIPLLKNGHSLHSKYDPQKEAQKIVSSLNAKGDFFVILGIGGAYIIEELKKHFPKSFILAFEHSKEDLDFLNQIPTFQKMSKEENVFFYPLNEIVFAIQKHYLPSFFNSIDVIENSVWKNENPSDIEFFRKEFNTAKEIVSRDFSVQSHFGKIWQNNILKNIHLVKNMTLDLPLEKKALVIGAGTTLDKQIDFIRKNKNDLYLIATDTSHKSLLQQNIFCDAVVSIDAQNISHTHFMQHPLSKNTLFIFDISSPHSTINFLTQNGCSVFFITTGHPLSSYIANFMTHPFLNLTSGGGTVTSAALDFALQAGFSDIEIIGADFCYKEKPYTKGTYLDTLQASTCTRVSPKESFFSSLMYRSELEKTKDGLQTKTFLAYKTQFEEFLKKNFLHFCKQNDKYICTAKKTSAQKIVQSEVDIHAFIKKFNHSFSYILDIDFFSEKTNYIQTNEVISLLPKIANLKKTHNFDSSLDFKTALKLAHDDFLVYTNRI